MCARVGPCVQLRLVACPVWPGGGAQEATSSNSGKHEEMCLHLPTSDLSSMLFQEASEPSLRAALLEIGKGSSELAEKITDTLEMLNANSSAEESDGGKESGDEESD